MSLIQRQLTVAFVTADIDAAIGGRVLDGTAIFVRVRAIGEPAATDERPQVAEKGGDFFGNHIPQLELPDAGRIDDVSATIQRNQLSRRRRMPTLLCFVADGADAQMQIGLNRIEQRRLADTTLAGDDTLLIGNQPPQPFDTEPGFRRTAPAPGTPSVRRRRSAAADRRDRSSRSC